MTEQIKILESFKETFSGTDNINAIDVAISALEKQIPKEVVHSHHCPQCDNALPCKGITDEYCSECFNWKYCPNCGQALKWK